MRYPFLLVLLAAAVPAFLCQAQPAPLKRADLPALLNFEMEHPGAAPARWGGGPPGTIFIDHEIVRNGKSAARLERSGTQTSAFTTMTLALPIDFAGKSIEFRGYIRTLDVTGFTGIWMREDGAGGSLAFDSTQKLGIKGTMDWKEHTIQLPLHADARTLYFGFLLSGSGKAWGDDFALLVDGKPIWEAPEAVRLKTALDTDTEFNAGSGISLRELSPAQTANLVTLGKVWGFLKYHHPAVTSGRYHWDYELYRILPAVLAAPDRAAGNAALAKWIAALGPMPPCKPCARLDEKDLYLRPDVAWISDEANLGVPLSKALREVQVNRPADGKQFFVTLNPMVQNPSFEHEFNYANAKLPDAGLQILAVYRFWNIIQYWYPNRDLLPHWDAALSEMLPKIAVAPDGDTYRREMMALIARVQDTHANLWSSLNVRPPVGPCRLPVGVRFVGNSAVVWDIPKPGEFEPGDVLTALDGATVASLVDRWRPYYAASNEPARLRDMAASLTRGECGETKVKLQRDGKELDLTTARVPPAGLAFRTTHDRPGDAFQMLGDDVAYLKLSAVVSADMPKYLDSASKTKGLVIDIRNYPKEFVVFTLGALLVDRPTDFAMFTSGDPANPGAFRFRTGDRITPKQPHYAGKIVVLVDEISQSQAEYTTMAFRAAGATVIGSTTAGADGNVSPIPLPGGLNSMISGIGVFYPDKKPTQQIGIVPDIEVKPTIEGIREGRDEVLEAALRQIRGAPTPPRR